MTWLIGWDVDGQRTAINLASARTITVSRDEQEPDDSMIHVEWSDSETLRSIMADGALVSDDATLILALQMTRKMRQ